jgi:hypothetical protein
MNKGNSDSVHTSIRGVAILQDSERLLFHKEELHMFKLGVEADTVVGWHCWCTFGGAQANWIGDNSQGASGRCVLPLEG